MLFLLALETLDDEERELIWRLYIDYSKKVKGISNQILHDEKLAYDAVNDTFLKVIQYKKKFLDVPEDERVRLLIIYTRSVCFNIYNRMKKIRFDSIESFAKDEDDNDISLNIPADTDLLKIIVEKETSTYIANAINKLKSPAREMIILKFYHEMRNVDIAELYSMKESTVSTVIQRSINKLRSELEDYLETKNN